MRTIYGLTLTIALTAASGLLAADTLQIPLGQQSNAQNASSLPQRGASSHNVEQRYGEPLKRHAAVGQPPISRWDYQGFSVYFEGGRVIHSVQQHVRSN